jgi:hypothetical protein
MVATQPTFNQVYDLARMLPNAYLQERRAHIAESERQIASGMVYSEEESDKIIDQIFDELSIVAA